MNTLFSFFRLYMIGVSKFCLYFRIFSRIKNNIFELFVLVCITMYGIKYFQKLKKRRRPNNDSKKKANNHATYILDDTKLCKLCDHSMS